MSLKQNTLAEATTENGFPTEVGVPLQREVTLEDGTKVIVESITPDKMKVTLNQNVDGNEKAVTFKTPGEIYKNDEVEIAGVCQVYNNSIIEPDLVSIEVTTQPTKTSYYVGDTFDTTGMVVTGTYSNGTSKEVTNYTVTPSGELTLEDTTITIAVDTISTELTITVESVPVVENFEVGKTYTVTYKDVPTKTITYFQTNNNTIFIRETIDNDALSIGVIPDYFVFGEGLGPVNAMVGCTGKFYFTADEIAAMSAEASSYGITDFNAPDNPTDSWYNVAVTEDTVGGGIAYTLTTFEGTPNPKTIAIDSMLEDSTSLQTMSVSKLDWLLESVVEVTE